MKLNHLNRFNESFLSIDIKDIKKKAYEFHKTSECRLAMSEVDINLLNNLVKEVTSLKDKYKSIDSAVNKIINKSESKNEGITGTILLTTFGLHAMIKMLIGIKNGWSIGEYLSRLFYSGGYDNELRTLRDIIITISFIIYLIVYLVFSTNYTSDTYNLRGTSVYVDLPFKWNGIHDYVVIDSYNKKYNFKRTGFGNWDISINNKIIGKCINGDIYNLENKKIFDDITTDHPGQLSNINLEKALTSKINHDKIENIKKKENEIEILKNKVDSIKQIVLENVDETRKFLTTKGIDYDTMSSNTQLDSATRNIANSIISLRKMMLENNNIGYLSTFVKFLFEKDASFVKNLYQRLIDIGNLADKLRDTSGNIKKVVNFTNSEELNDAIDRVLDWQKVNMFIRNLPPTQKRLIWKDGYYTEELKPMSQYLTNNILKICSDEKSKNSLLSKISSIKNTKSLIDIISSISNNEPWDYNYWLNKLESSRNVIVTWKSEEQKMIICSVFTHAAIQKLAYMTNWCIFRRKDYFDSYLAKGFQFILYDFSKDPKGNESVIGFTTTLQNRITDCNDKSDYYTHLPSFIYNEKEINYKYIKNEYIKINTMDMLKKLDMSVFKIAANKIKKMISNKYISNFLDMYDPS